MLEQVLRTLALGTLITCTLADFSLFPNDTISSSVNLSTQCTNALTSSVACDPYLLQLSQSDYYGSLGDDSLQSSLCITSCGTSLVSYHTSVISSCANDAQPWLGIPAQTYGDLLWSTYNLTCLKDTGTGEWCNDYISNMNITDDSSVVALSKSQQCSPCILALFQHLQSTPYSSYNDELAKDWTSVQQLCGVSYPTIVQPPAANVTVPGYSTSAANATCLTNQYYTVTSGDDCESIAEAHHVAQGTLIVINGILPDCSNLEAGASICMPQNCTTYKTVSGDTCSSIVLATGITFQALLTYNPTINSECTNLLADVTICISSPYPTWNGTTIAGASPTHTGVYATTTVSPPGITAHGTTQYCGRYYQVQPGDICEKVALNNTIAIPLFEAINPSINPACTNLVPNLWYCVSPLSSWNATTGSPTSSPVLAPPTSTPTGTTGQCYEWYTIAKGDYCSLIESSFAITFAQFQAWNPSLKSDCSNLIPGEAYCVHGPSSSVSSSASNNLATATATPTSSSPMINLNELHQDVLMLPRKF